MLGTVGRSFHTWELEDWLLEGWGGGGGWTAEAVGPAAGAGPGDRTGPGHRTGASLGLLTGAPQGPAVTLKLLCSQSSWRPRISSFLVA